MAQNVPMAWDVLVAQASSQECLGGSGWGPDPMRRQGINYSRCVSQPGSFALGKDVYPSRGEWFPVLCREETGREPQHPRAALAASVAQARACGTELATV